MESDFQKYQEGSNLPKQVSTADFQVEVDWQSAKFWTVRKGQPGTHSYPDPEKKMAVDGEEKTRQMLLAKP